MIEKGYIQVYTGNGKGKTTAALGIAVRAVCAGGKVFMGQFMKGGDYSELKAPDYLPRFELEQFGEAHFISGEPSDEDIRKAQAGLSRMREVLTSGEYDLVIFDEINTAVHFKLITAEEALGALEMKPDATEVIMTGRYAPKEITDKADLVTEMKEIKHYYNIGVNARPGIEN